jgi:hypothetical protein
MADLTIRVPPEHGELLAAEFLRRYATLAHKLHAAAARQASSGDALDDLLGTRVELLDLDDALDQLGWGAAPPGGALELTAHPEVLADALTGVLVAAAGRVARDRQATGADIVAELSALEALVELTGLVLGVRERQE